jgi:hypothetical protein
MFGYLAWVILTYVVGFGCHVLKDIYVVEVLKSVHIACPTFYLK